ncbi:unnamed protein product [Hydatigera taeniaeformis]|uniref:guanylate cyclase n=1 Tax=Hydatigena taeniaeformis TaxID=6205 RepID=A0A0R3WL32_HYDTA|nr:unnamed protein product [Hydatigera taeniaeformis]
MNRDEVMQFVVLVAIFTTSESHSAGNGESLNTQRQLTIYIPSFDSLYYNFTHSVTSAVAYSNSLMPVKNAIIFLGASKKHWMSSYSMQEGSRPYTLCELLHYLQRMASNSSGFSVLLGPPLDSYCNLISEWIRLGDPQGKQREQLYQVSYHCRVFGFYADFVNYPTDVGHYSLESPLAAVSVLVQRKSILQGIIMYLLSKGWKRAALFYDMTTTNFDFPGTWDLISLNVHLSRKRQNVPQLLALAVILARPSVAIEFVVSIQNLTKIKEGRIALIQVDPKDMLTYDALRAWRWHLSKAAPTMSAGRSLIVLTALPKGTVYKEESIIFKEGISLQVASGAALAMRLVQIHIQEGGDHINSSTNFFEPMRANSTILVPALPNITFRYSCDEGNVIEGNFDFLFFALRPKITDVVDTENHTRKYEDIFNLIDIIHYPPILPQWKCKMDWPGDGEGPQRTQCLIAPCDFDSIKSILVMNSLGFLCACFIYFGAVIIYRLNFLESDFVFADEGESVKAGRCEDRGRLASTCVVGSSFHAFRTDAQAHMSSSSLSEETLPSIKKMRIASLDDVIRNKSITFDWEFKLSLMNDLVRVSRYDIMSFPYVSSVYVEANSTCYITKGMEYLHSTSLKAHGRLKSTNCVVNCRWVLKITDYGIPKIYNLIGSYPSMEPQEKLWTSPELLRDEQTALFGTRPGDVYAFGIIMHEVFYQTKPYGPGGLPVKEILKRVMGKESPPFRPQLLEAGIPPAYTGILERAWSENPSLRPTFKELKREIQQMTRGKKTDIVEHMIKLLENYSSWLEEQVKTRTEELSAEKKKKDLLIRRMLPPVVAEALKAGIAVAPETYDEVSIYISDIVGFTTISAMSTPLQVVDLLNDLYTLFDKTIANYDVYKVETIGDAYMVASGLPVRNGRQHASEVATMALDLLSVCGTFTIKHLPEVPLRLRIGLHSGPCVAGVVGLTMPRYCLFGSTVNRALKMESSGAG